MIGRLASVGGLLLFATFCCYTISAAEPAAEEEPPLELVLVEKDLVVGEHYVVGVNNISFTDIADNTNVVRIYPDTGVKVFDNVSFIQKKVYFLLFTKKPGTYWLVFINNGRFSELKFVVSQGGQD